jgi:hypothetical protein
MFKFKVSVLLVSACMAVPVFAVDGVTLIDQATVMSSGGFPFHISLSGSYRLSSNLTASNTSAILITAPYVTLDLNGFTVTCAPCGAVAGIASMGRGTTIAHGNVTGFRGAPEGPNAGVNAFGIHFVSSQAKVEDIRVDHNGTGIGADADLVVVNSIASANTVAGITGGIVTVLHSQIDGNGHFGVLLDKGLVSGNTIVENGLGPFVGVRGGVAIGTSASVTNNIIANNQMGIATTTGGPGVLEGYGANTFNQNKVDVFGGPAVSMKTNACSAGAC